MSTYTYKRRRTKGRSKSTTTAAQSLESIAHILGAAALLGSLWIIPRIPSGARKNEGHKNSLP